MSLIKTGHTGKTPDTDGTSGGETASQPFFRLIGNIDNRGELTDAQQSFYQYIEASKPPTTEAEHTPVGAESGDHHLTRPVRERLNADKRQSRRDEILFYRNGTIEIILSNPNGVIRPDAEAGCLNTEYKSYVDENINYTANGTRGRDTGSGIDFPEDPYTRTQYFSRNVHFRTYNMVFYDNGAMKVVGQTKAWDVKDQYAEINADLDGNGKLDSIRVYGPNSPAADQCYATALRDGIALSENEDKYETETVQKDMNGDGIVDIVATQYKRKGKDKGEIYAQSIQFKTAPAAQVSSDG